MSRKPVNLSTLHPWIWITAVARPWVFAITACLAVALGIILTIITPQIVDFEMTGDLGRSRELLEAWGNIGQKAAGFNLGLDYLYMLIYATALGLGCILVKPVLMERFKWWADLGHGLAWGVPVAALSDAVENYCLLEILLNGGPPGLAVIARWAALFKFGLVLPALAYTLTGLLFVARATLQRRKLKTN